MSASHLKILVVEDDTFQRQLVANMLRSLNCRIVLEAGTGNHALDILRSNRDLPVDVVLCDLNMPEMDGIEFLRHLGGEKGNVKIILTSALDARLLDSVANMARMYGLSLLGTLEKPITLLRLRDMLQRYAQQDARVAAFPRAVPPVEFALEEILDGVQAQQFVPYFQPKINLQTGQLYGAEALVRWMHPRHGVVGPGAFISHLEREGKLDEITWQMLSKSAQVCRPLFKQGLLDSVSVNLSIGSLDNPLLTDRLTEIVRDAGIEPQSVVLEVTESAAATNAASVLENLARLGMKGFTLSIDDYGTGYSSMQQLTRIAFNELKIDQSFVKDCARNEALSIVVSSSIDMAHKLKMSCTAEGVETEADWDALAAMGCDIAQGYLIARPMPADEFLAFVGGYAGRRPTGDATESRKRRSAMTVLLVDDDPFTRQLVHSLLRPMGFGAIVAVPSAEAALEAMSAQAFDLVVTDVDMGRLNGLAFIQMVRAGRTLARRDTRIVVLSAFSRADILGPALALDVNGFLVKPVTPAAIEEKLAKALDEIFSLAPPLAYEAVKTDFRFAPPSWRGTADTGTSNTGEAARTSARKERFPPHRLRPGMALLENVYLADGTLLLSAGHRFTQLSINRLNDLGGMLREAAIVATEATSASVETNPAS